MRIVSPENRAYLHWLGSANEKNRTLFMVNIPSDFGAVAREILSSRKLFARRYWKSFTGPLMAFQA
jgi:hypothetical protein